MTQYYGELLSSDILGMIQSLSRNRLYTEVEADLTQATDDLSEVEAVLDILYGLDHVGYEELDAGLRALASYMDWLSEDDLQPVVRMVTEGDYWDTTYADLAAEANYWQNILSIVNSLIWQLGNLYYPAFDATLRTLAEYTEALIPELAQTVQEVTALPLLTTLNDDIADVTQAIDWRQQLDQVQIDLAEVQEAIAQLEQNIAAAQAELAEHPNLDTILTKLKDLEALINSLNAQLEALDVQFSNLAVKYLSVQNNNYGSVDTWLFYVDGMLKERYGYVPDYKTAEPLSAKYKEIFFDPRSGDFKLPDGNRVPWDYFDITDGPYGPLNWKLSQINVDDIRKMDKEQLLDLRGDLLTSWGKGDKSGNYTQYGDIRFTRDSLIKQGYNGELNPDLPTTRDALVKAIDDKEADLADAQADQAYWQNEYTIVDKLLDDIAAWQQQLAGLQKQGTELKTQRDTLQGYLDESKFGGKITLPELQAIESGYVAQRSELIGYLDAAAELLPDQRDILAEKVKSIENDISGLETILENAAGVLYDILPEEQARLEQQRGTLIELQYARQSEIGQIQSMLGSVIEMLPSEGETLQGQLGVFETEQTLWQDLVEYDDEVTGWQLQIGDYQMQLANLDAQQYQMEMALAGIIQQKWTERFALGDAELTFQTFEADTLRAVQDLRLSQGTLALSGITQTFRNNLSGIEAQITSLSTQLNMLKGQQQVLSQQLQQAQAAQEGPASIYIRALGLHISSDLPAFQQDGGSELQQFNDGWYDLPPIDGGGKIWFADGRQVAQEESSGYYIYENPQTYERFYRDVAGTPEDPEDDTFYVRQVELEYDSEDETSLYCDIHGTPDDTRDDTTYDIALTGEVPIEVYPFDGAYVVRKWVGVTTEVRTETRDDTGQQYQVTIRSDLYSVQDYRYRFLAFAAEPEFGEEQLFILDTVNRQAVNFSEILDDLEAELQGDGQLIVLYPGRTLEDLGIDQVTSEDVLVTFLDFVPVFTPLSGDGFDFVDPKDYSGTKVEEVPALFAEVLYNGQLLLPVVALEDGNINLANVSLTASESLTFIAANKIIGLNAGQVFSADTVYIQSREDLHIGGSILGKDLVDIQTFGDLYLDETALIQADTVSFMAAWGSVVASQGSSIVGETFIAQAMGEVDVYSDFDEYEVSVTGAGNVTIHDSNTLGRDKTVSLEDVSTAEGMVSVLADSSISAFAVAGSNIELVAMGEGSIEFGNLQTWGSSVWLDAARYVREIPEMTCSIEADELTILAGLDITASAGIWSGIDETNIRGNLSILIDESYAGPFVLTAERDIIIDTQVVTAGVVDLQAQNIIFTENGAIRSLAGAISIEAENELRFSPHRAFGTQNTPVIQGTNVAIQAGRLSDSGNVLVSGDCLSIIADSGFGLRTQVRQLNAQLLGPGDLQIDALSSIELGSVEVLDGDLEVTSAGNIFARDVRIATDRYCNKLGLSAAGNISFNGVQVGQLVEIAIEAGTGVTNTNYTLQIRPRMTTAGPIYQGSTASFHIEISDPSRSFIPEDGLIPLLVDFGDGSEPQSFMVEYIQPGPQVWDPPSLVIEEAEGWYFRSATGAGDVNGDGFDDLIVGQMHEEGGGSVLLYLGTEEGLNPVPAMMIAGLEASGAGFGQVLAAAGDVNGDGYDDILVGAPGQMVEVPVVVVNENGSIEQQYKTVMGQVFLYMGTADGLAEEPAWTTFGLEVDEYQWTSMLAISSAGDVNADGYDDVLVGWPTADQQQIQASGLLLIQEAGMVQLFLGSPRPCGRGGARRLA